MQNTSELTKNGFDNIVKQIRKHAGENVRVRFFSGAIWVFGSELATLRLFKRHVNDLSGAVQGFSQNYASHYFKYETRGLHGERDTLEG